MSKSSFTDLTTAYSAYRGQSRGSYRGSSGSNFRGNRYNNRGSYRGRNGNPTGRRGRFSSNNAHLSNSTTSQLHSFFWSSTRSPSPHQLNGSSIASSQSTSASSQPRSSSPPPGFSLNPIQLIATSSQPPSQHLLHTPIPHAENSSPVASNSIPQAAIPHAENSSHVASNSIPQAATRSPILPSVVSNQSSHHPMITRSKLGIRKP
ncbi:hypothetical protein U1Q18_035479, partial [Sarracenia purpurea var. burkii]